ncbi:MAG: NYN domain-containing protein [Patescibacteria group bacterium]
MFIPKTERIKKLAGLFPDEIEELKNIFKDSTHVYVDWSNVFHWQGKLGWHIHQGRLKQLLDSFDTIKSVKIYMGTLEGNQKSEDNLKELASFGYDIKTKPVKLMKMSINTSSIPSNSAALLENFIKKCLLSKFNLSTIEYLNSKLADLNKQGITYIEDMKCNFDVEIGRDMLLDFERKHAENFVLWSGDSDFTDPISQLLGDNKTVYLFATSRRVSYELNEIGLPIFDIKKIKEFICWPKEIPQSVKDKIA